MNRRQALTLSLAGIAATTGCRRERSAVPALPEPAPLAGTPEEPSPVAPPRAEPLEGADLTALQVDPTFEIRSISGLRPFRSAGFVVRKDEIGGKSIIHNYGHGGGGISLSWGTAHLATQLAGSLAGVECAVIGGGVMGLSTARLLQLHGARVTLHTRDLPPQTTSNIAGGQWWPVSVYDRSSLTDAFAAQYLEAANFAYRYFQNLVGPRWGVRWMPNYYLSEGAPQNGGMSGPGGTLHHLQVGFRDFGPGEHVFPANYVRRFHSMLIEPATYLNTLMQEVRSAGAFISIREFPDLDSILQLPQSHIFNCTGLGARTLFGDEALIPVKGQLSVLMPQPAVQFNLITDSYYMFPRSDGVILGGTFERGQWDNTPDPAVSRRILQGTHTLFDQMRTAQAAALQ